MNSENREIPKPHVFILKFTNKWDWTIRKKVIASSNQRIYYTWKNIKSPNHNNKLKRSAPRSDGEFDLPDGSYFVSDIQDYLGYNLKKHGESKSW